MTEPIAILVSGDLNQDDADRHAHNGGRANGCTHVELVGRGLILGDDYAGQWLWAYVGWRPTPLEAAIAALETTDA